MENVKNLVRMEGYKLLCIRKALFGYLALMVFSAFAIQSAGFFFFILLYPFNPRAREADAGRFLNSRPV